MPIGIIEEYVGADVALYDTVAKMVDFPAIWPDGLLYHSCGETDDGIRIVEEWDKPESYTKFMADVILPAIATALNQTPEEVAPKVTQFVLHNQHTTRPAPKAAV